MAGTIEAIEFYRDESTRYSAKFIREAARRADMRGSIAAKCRLLDLAYIQTIAVRLSQEISKELKHDNRS